MKAVIRGARTRVSRFDDVVDAAFDHLRGRPAADRVFYTATELGDFSLVWVLIAAARGLRSERDWHGALRLGAAVGAESLLVNGLIKSVFRRTRPPWEVERPLRMRRPLTSSFPSGHASSAFSAAVLLSDHDDLWPLYYAVAVVVASSRVYVKIHHASDVVAGAALGVVLGTLWRKVAPLPAVDPAADARP
jgi:undecaprenyl-diphosphatase